MECLVWGICYVILGSVWYVVYVMVHSIWGVINADFGLVCLEWCVLWDICIVVGIMYFVRGVWYCLFDISMGCLALGVCHGVDIIMCLVWSIGYDMSSMECFVWDVWHGEFGMVILLWGAWSFTDMYCLSICEATRLILNKVSVV